VKILEVFELLKHFYNEMGGVIAGSVRQNKFTWLKLNKKELNIRLKEELKKEDWLMVGIVAMLLWGREKERGK